MDCVSPSKATYGKKKYSYLIDSRCPFAVRLVKIGTANFRALESSPYTKKLVPQAYNF